MLGLKHITEEELRRYYYLDGQISGNAKKINILNGIQQDYVGSCISSFMTWNDEWNKSKFELYVKENLPKIEIRYNEIVSSSKKEDKNVKKQDKNVKKQDKNVKKQDKNVKKKIFNKPYQRENQSAKIFGFYYDEYNSEKIMLQKYNTPDFNCYELTSKKLQERKIILIQNNTDTK